ncbi:MAG TPA: cytochrome c family protein [Bauldia sp.]|nr:cytochrome c family protein [Bauldia sp.]
MDSFEFNKIAGAVLATALGVMALGIIGEMIYAQAVPEKPGFVIAVAETPDGGTPAAAAVAPIEVRLASADPAAGQAIAKKCLGCHSLDPSGARGPAGPNLYNVVGAPAAHMEGFPYSKAMLDRRAAGGKWTFADLDKFLTSPKAFVPGTAMGFAGLPKPEDRANVIDYLRTLSPNPLPVPPPPAADASAPAAGGTAAPAATAPAAATPPGSNPPNPAAPATPPAPAQ